MRLLSLVLGLLLAFAARAQDEGPPKPPPRMPVDETPTHYACTMDRLLRGERCTFEFDPVPGSNDDSLARDNSKSAAVAARYCADAATPQYEHRADVTLRKMCEDEVARVSLDGCSLGGRIPLEDHQGRVAGAASECADSLGHVLARTRTMAGFSLGCCRCLAEARCSVPAAQCNREMVDLIPGDALQSCLANACKDSCSAAQREDPLAPPPLPPPMPRSKSSRKSSAEEPLKI